MSTRLPRLAIIRRPGRARVTPKIDWIVIPDKLEKTLERLRLGDTVRSNAPSLFSPRTVEPGCGMEHG